MIADWQQRTPDPLIPQESAYFHFPPHLKYHVIRALAVCLQADPPVFRISTTSLCRYLSTHSDLGDAPAIRRALYRAINARCGNNVYGLLGLRGQWRQRHQRWHSPLGPLSP